MKHLTEPRKTPDYAAATAAGLQSLVIALQRDYLEKGGEEAIIRDYICRYLLADIKRIEKHIIEAKTLGGLLREKRHPPIAEDYVERIAGMDVHTHIESAIEAETRLRTWEKDYQDKRFAALIEFLKDEEGEKK